MKRGLLLSFAIGITACGDSEPERNEITHHIRDGGGLCWDTVGKQVKESAWLDEFYDTYRNEIDSLVDDVTDSTSTISFSKSNGDTFNISWGYNSYFIKIQYQDHSYSAHLDMYKDRLDRDSDSMMIDGFSISRYTENTVIMRRMTQSDYVAFDQVVECKTPEISYMWVEGRRKQTLVFDDPTGAWSAVLYTRFREGEYSDYLPEPTGYSGYVCFNGDCKGYAELFITDFRPRFHPGIFPFKPLFLSYLFPDGIPLNP